MEGWPEGWTDFGANERFVGADGRYVLYGEREGCRRAAWAIEGNKAGAAINREALAKALHTAYGTGAGQEKIEWDKCSADTRKGYLAEADEAIRLLSFEPRVGRVEMLTTIEELERRNDILTATANAAVARAEEAQLQAQRDEQDSETIALRAEVQRLRRALDRTAQAAAYLTDALSELTGGDHA